jgi:hypothetical protein
MRSSAVTCGVAVLAGLLFCQGCGRSVRDSQGNVEARISYGTLRATLDRGIDRVFAAVQGAVNDLGLTTITARQDSIAAEVLARDAQQQNITIRLDALSPDRTELSMRVGMLGDENKSLVIFREIQENLRAG